MHIDNVLSHIEKQLRIAKEASLRVSDDDDDDDNDIDLLCADVADTDALELDDSMQDASQHASSPIIEP